MGPEVIAFDELGRPEEVEALRDLLYAGVGVLTTAHAGSIEEMTKRPILSSVLGIGGFERVIVLSRRLGVGTVEGIWDGTAGEMLSFEPFRLVGGSW
jgi:stage III sporulation protein AA